MAKKFTVEMTPEMDKVVEELAAKRGIPKTQAVRTALAVLKYLDEAEENHEELILRSKSGTDTKLVVGSMRGAY